MPDGLIWGASGGIGAAMVRTLKAKGWRVFGAARNMAQIPPCDRKLPFDLDDEATLKDAAHSIAGESAGLDFVLYAVGSLCPEGIAKMSAPCWEVAIRTNLTGAFLAASYSLNLLKPEGEMAFMGAYIDHLILPKMSAYTAAKAGLEAFVGVLRKENRAARFSIVRPGPVDTDFWQNVPFRKPPNAKPPQAVAEAILAHHESGEKGDVNL